MCALSYYWYPVHTYTLTYQHTPLQNMYAMVLMFNYFNIKCMILLIFMILALMLQLRNLSMGVRRNLPSSLRFILHESILSHFPTEEHFSYFYHLDF